MVEENNSAQLNAKSVYANVVELLNHGKYSQALQVLEKLPKNLASKTPAWLNAYGVAYRGVGKPMHAIKAYLLALQLEPDNEGTWSNLGNAYKDANFIQASIEAHKKAISKSAQPSATRWHNYGLALSIAGLHEQAISAYESALKLEPSQKGVMWDLARAQLYMQNYKDGFANYKYRWEMKDAPIRRVKGREWQGQNLDKSEHLLVYVEQGFGDYLQCARYLKELKNRAPNCSVEVKPELRRLMCSNFQNINFKDYVENPYEVKDGYVVSILELPNFFQDDIFVGHEGYLTAKYENFTNKDLVRNVLSDFQGKNIGIVWSGSLTFKRNQYRATSPEWFIDSFNLPGVRMHSLQMGPLTQKADKYPESILDQRLVRSIQDFSDTAYVVSQLDLVVTTCTSVVHLCGALGVPCWVLLDYSPHWLWGVEASRTPWYDSIRLFRQVSPGDWRSAFDLAIVEMMEWLQS